MALETNTARISLAFWVQSKWLVARLSDKEKACSAVEGVSYVTEATTL